jgi:hypothetical protein
MHKYTIFHPTTDRRQYCLHICYSKPLTFCVRSLTFIFSSQFPAPTILPSFSGLASSASSSGVTFHGLVVFIRSISSFSPFSSYTIFYTGPRFAILKAFFSYMAKGLSVSIYGSSPQFQTNPFPNELLSSLTFITFDLMPHHSRPFFTLPACAYQSLISVIC